MPAMNVLEALPIEVAIPLVGVLSFGLLALVVRNHEDPTDEIGFYDPEWRRDDAA